MGIRDFSKKSKIVSRVEKFEELVEGKTNEEKRALERMLLKPDTLPPHTISNPNRSAIEERTFKIVFANDIDMELFRRHFRISAYKGLNTRDVDIIVALLEAIESGFLRYDQTEKKIYFIDDQGGEIQL